MIPSLYLESKLNTNSTSTIKQALPKTFVASIHPRTTLQQLTASNIYSKVDGSLQTNITEIKSGT